MDIQQMLEMEKEEMRKHRWIESEKVQYDLGSCMYLDWILRYARDWRIWFEETYGDATH
jgi:hypothetical protein